MKRHIWQQRGFRLTWAIIFHIIPTTRGLYCEGYIPLFAPFCRTCQYLSADLSSVAVSSLPTSLTWRATFALSLTPKVTVLPYTLAFCYCMKKKQVRYLYCIRVYEIVWECKAALQILPSLPHKLIWLHMQKLIHHLMTLDSVHSDKLLQYLLPKNYPDTNLSSWIVESAYQATKDFQHRAHVSVRNTWREKVD